MNKQPQDQLSFDGLGIAPKLLAILDKLNFKIPTPIQLQAIPIGLEGKDVMGIAQTGTGKTLAFGIPMIQRLVQLKGAKGLVILPTRELAVQVNESLHTVGKTIGLKTAVLIGGEAIPRQIKALRADPHIIIATPGRLIDHLEQKTVKLDQVKILVLDEADRMLDMGFGSQIKRVLQHVPAQRQTMLFSATMPQEILGIATKYMQLPIRVEVSPSGTTSKKITQEVFIVSKDRKLPLLLNLLNEYRGSVLVFSRTKFGAKKIAAVLRRSGQSSAEIHSNRSLSQRLEALNGFKLGKYRVLVATDIAARGIDVVGIELVINYDLPENPEDYVHRIGRTGRANHEGRAISFATPDQRHDLFSIERLIKNKLNISALPALAEMPKQDFVRDLDRDEQRPRREFRPREYSRPQREQHRPAPRPTREFPARDRHGNRQQPSRGFQSRRPEHKRRASGPTMRPFKSAFRSPDDNQF